MTSLWLDGRVEAVDPNVPLKDDTFDVAVVGAGITGLTTALLLARAGKKVVVLEARHVGAATTGNTTGKVSLLQGTKLSRIRSQHDDRVLRDYVEGNTEGRDWLLHYMDAHGLSVQREDAYTYAQFEAGIDSARAELAACRAAGLPAEWVDSADVPFPFAGGVRLPEQAQIDPIPLLDSFVVELEQHGGTLVQGARVRSVSVGTPVRLRIDRAGESSMVTAAHCILATGVPILDRGGFFAKVSPHRSYCVAFDVPGDITRPMFLSTDAPSRSVRYAPTPGGDLLIVGGGSHTVGRARDAAGGVSELVHWAKQHFPGAVQTHYWSAQDYSPIDELPYAGPILPGTRHIWVATGFDKWGMTNGIAAALALSGQILGGHMPWAGAFAAWSPHELTGLSTALKHNLSVGYHLAKGWVEPVTRHAEPDEGHGVVSGPPWRLHADSVVDGIRRTVSPVCPHLGGIVSWNDADCAWECPLHGSRFAPDGTLLEGPATRGLTAQGHS
ncbi:FAD-dependent oxidoreductase [Mycolicibacterium neoaurum]|uniref:FAD-dependent oxidoreductase n=1 Tax=Mycolicibacterium neoaurum TaxID=1795 RepID=UPI001F4CF7C6|nr:FAD-dependent oxidoreductase [Mycolicibacterium neoaurum]